MGGGFEEGVLHSFSLGMPFAIGDAEFSEVKDRFFGGVELFGHVVVAEHDLGLFGKGRRSRDRLILQKGADFGENPWISDSAASDDDTVETGIVQSGDNLLGGVEIAAAYDGKRRKLTFQFFQEVPVGTVVVSLFDGAAVDDEGVGLIYLGHVKQFMEHFLRNGRLVKSDTDFHHDRTGNGVSHRLINLDDSVGILQEKTSSFASKDLGDGAGEIEVDEIEPFLDKDFRGGSHGFGIVSDELRPDGMLLIAHAANWLSNAGGMKNHFI